MMVQEAKNVLNYHQWQTFSSAIQSLIQTRIFLEKKANQY